MVSSIEISDLEYMSGWMFVGMFVCMHFKEENSELYFSAAIPLKIQFLLRKLIELNGTSI